MENFDITILISIIGGLVLITNVITEVLKSIFKQLPPQITATVIAIAGTVVAFAGYSSIAGIPTTWWMWVAAIVVGFFVSYGAQFGFDKLKEIIDHYIKIK